MYSVSSDNFYHDAIRHPSDNFSHVSTCTTLAGLVRVTFSQAFHKLRGKLVYLYEVGSLYPYAASVRVSTVSTVKFK